MCRHSVNKEDGIPHTSVWVFFFIPRIVVESSGTFLVSGLLTIPLSSYPQSGMCSHASWTFQPLPCTYPNFVLRKTSVMCSVSTWFDPGSSFWPPSGDPSTRRHGSHESPRSRLVDQTPQPWWQQVVQDTCTYTRPVPSLLPLLFDLGSSVNTQVDCNIDWYCWKCLITINEGMVER